MVTSPCLMSSSSLNDLAIDVVEDHHDARRYLDLFLGQLWAKVVAASNAFDGLRAKKNTLSDLVLADIQMSGMDGFELLENIRALGRDAGGNVLVIAMSAFFSLADRARIHHADFRACFAEAIYTRQVSGKDSGCLLSHLCAELLARSAPLHSGQV